MKLMNLRAQWEPTQICSNLLINVEKSDDASNPLNPFNLELKHYNFKIRLMLLNLAPNSTFNVNTN